MTTIAFQLPRDQEISLQVFDTNGRVVRTLASGMHQQGGYRVNWNGASDAGSGVPSGVYFYRLRTEEGDHSRSLRVLRSKAKSLAIYEAPVSEGRLGLWPYRGEEVVHCLGGLLRASVCGIFHLAFLSSGRKPMRRFFGTASGLMRLLRAARIERI